MTYSYFPGCTLKTKGKDLDLWGRVCAEKLGFTLEELPQWQCCGAVYPMAKDEIAPRLSSVRALTAARDKGQALVTLCSMPPCDQAGQFRPKKRRDHPGPGDPVSGCPLQR